MRDSFVPEYQSFRQRKMMSREPEPHRCRCHDEAEVYQSEVYQPARPDALDRFGGPEHRQIGDLAIGKLPTTIVYDDRGTTLTFGEVIALAGDLFDDYFQMKELSRTPEGRSQLRWALWYAMNKVGPEPIVRDEIKTIVEDNYQALAGKNISHFSAGGTAWQTYFRWHSIAMVQALDAGIESSDKIWREAFSKEAFALHFLTDSFSSGHVRTPRQEMQDWYQKHFGHALKKFVDRFAGFMWQELKKHNRELRYPGSIPILGLLPKYFVKRTAGGDLGKELKRFTLDDPIALAIHDIDNENGLPVISPVDPSGKPVKGGYPWYAFGDGKLGEPSPTSKKPETQNMVVSAVKASLKDLHLIRAAGAKHKGKKLSQSQRLAIMKGALGITGLWNKVAAAAYWPKEDTSKSTKLPEWRWGKLDQQVYDRVNKTMATDFSKGFRDKAAKERLKGPKTVAKIVKIEGTADALYKFSELLRTRGITYFEDFLGKAK